MCFYFPDCCDVSNGSVCLVCYLRLIVDTVVPVNTLVIYCPVNCLAPFSLVRSNVAYLSSQNTKDMFLLCLRWSWIRPMQTAVDRVAVHRRPRRITSKSSFITVCFSYHCATFTFICVQVLYYLVGLFV